MIMEPIDKFVTSQKLTSNARTLNASIHVAMVCSLEDRFSRLCTYEIDFFNSWFHYQFITRTRYLPGRKQ